ncbi:MAG: hemerythrin domain-containing protein [Pseudomonadota bacterium]
MKLALETLYKDHDNLRSILCLLERLLIDIYRGSSENYQMIQRILIYIQDYPACIHHPVEYAVFSSISEDGCKNRKFHEDVNNLMKEHIEIDGIISNSIEAVGSMLAGTHYDIADIGGELSTLINLERSHLLFEEMYIYPYIAEHMGDEDWETISVHVPDYEDPIFGNKIKRGYELIFNAL